MEGCRAQFAYKRQCRAHRSTWLVLCSTHG